MGSSQSRRESTSIFHGIGDSNVSPVGIGASRALELLTNQDMERIAMESSLADAPLPPGWEQAVCPRSFIYFIDYFNMRTTYCDPRIPSYRGRDFKKFPMPPPYQSNFYSKCQHLRARIRQLQSDDGSLVISVSRNDLFRDSFDFISNLDSFTLTRRLSIKFKGEPGLDYGGMSREWFLELGKEILLPRYGLFTPIVKNYYIEPSSIDIPNYDKVFHFVGVILGMAAYHGKLFHSYFIIPFYKLLMGMNVGIHDVKYYDEQIYNSLLYILETPGCTKDMDINFSLVEQCRNKRDVKLISAENMQEFVGSSNSNWSISTTTEATRIVELKPGGSEIMVDEQNKAEYVRLCVEYYLCRTKLQMDAIREGFCQFVPSALSRAILTPSELKLLIGGIEGIDVNDLKKHTQYQGGYTQSSSVVIWFWDVVKQFSLEQLKLFLHFVTGTDRVPIGGFEHLYGSSGPCKFTINKTRRQGLPAAHSCFNRLDLPEYTCKHVLRRNLLYAITEAEGFEIE